MEVGAKYIINPTGGYKDDYMFNHMILSIEQYNAILADNPDIIKFADANNVHFISVKKNGSIEFLHVTSPANDELIEQSGLKINEDEYVMDLGKGIYAILDTKDVTYKGMDNLKTYIAEGYADNEILIVQGYYTGEYLECMYGYQHEGYIVLLNNVPSKDIWNIRTETIDDFLFG